MRLKRNVWTAVLACAVMAVPAFGQAAGKDDEKAMMDAMMKAGTPGSEHKQLEALAGSWTVDITMWMAPGQPPMQSKGSSEITPIFEGRYLREEYKGDFMGMPFQGTGLSGYDNVQKRYFGTWADSVSTTVITLWGSYDDATKTYTYEGMMPDPLSGKNKPMRMATRVVDKNKHVVESWDSTPDGKWVKVMEMTYTRK